MIGIDKTDQWDEENAGKPLPPTYTQLEARVAKLEAEYARAEKIAVNLHAITKKAMDRIAELEAEIAQRDSNWARNLAGDLIAAGESEYVPDPRAAHIAELEAENTRLKTAVTEWEDAAHRQAAEVARLTEENALLGRKLVLMQGEQDKLAAEIARDRLAVAWNILRSQHWPDSEVGRLSPDETWFAGPAYPLVNAIAAVLPSPPAEEKTP